MRNLVVERDLSAQLDLGDDGALSFCVSAAEAQLYAMTSDGMVHCFSLGDRPQAMWRCDLGAELFADVDALPGGNGAWVTSFSHVLELDALCIATRAGTIALLHLGEGGERRFEQVGSISDGVAALEWSPDGELLALLSGSANLLVMNQAWELLHEGPALGPTAAGAAPPLPPADTPQPCEGGISWRGDGKFFAVVCPQPAAAPAQAPPFRVAIWDRATLELHASGEAAEGLLPLPAWQPNGRHLYVPGAAAAPEAGVRPAAAAAAAAAGATAAAAAAETTEAAAVSGSGEVVARGGATCRSVLLYERNGLRHGGFDLTSAGPVCSMAWSCDSELLALVTSPSAPPEEATSSASADGSGASHDWVIQVWHRSNWHWYLKHERRYAPSVGRTAGAGPLFRWDEQHGGVMHVLTPRGLYEQVCLAWDTCVSERGTAAVVDGRRLLLTPLRHGLLPPPMCAAYVELPEAAVDVCISALPPAGASSPEEADEVVAVLTSSGRLALARSVEEDLWEETAEDQDALAAERGGAPPPPAGGPAAAPRLLPALPRLDIPLAGGRRARALSWFHGASSLLLLAAPYPEPGLEEGEGDVLVQVDVEWLSRGPADPDDPRARPEVRLTEGPPVYAGGRVLRLAPHPAGGAVALELAGGGVARLGLGEAAVRTCGPRAALPAACRVVRPVPAAALLHPDDPPLLGLSPAGMLCLGGTVISPSDVTSFAVRAHGPGGPALLFTTRKNLLYTVLMSQLPFHTHRELTADPRTARQHKREGDMLTAMHAAMRPDAATAAARNVTVRAVEAGAALVACPAAALGGPLSGRLADVPVVLQMPRGNLEGVAPRALVLAALVLALRRLDYGEAWRLATVHRVELNLLVDYGWPSFIQHVPQFVAAVPRPADLCDLLFALRPGSVLAQGGAYADALAMLGEGERGAGPQGQGQAQAQGPQPQQQEPIRGSAGTQAVGRGRAANAGAGASRAAAPEREGAAAGGAGGGGKVTAVCNAMREVVAALPGASSNYLEVVVTTYARSDPPQLEAAMRCIRDAKEAELKLENAPNATTAAAGAVAAAGPAPSSSGPAARERQVAAAAAAAAAPHNHSSSADKALKHLLLYIDADELYNTALGMYDMPLAYMVVVNAQKDPGEYLGELQGFAALAPPPLQRYHIDMHLRRFASALANLAQAGPQHFQQALQLARERGLLRQLLQLYDSNPDHRPAALEAYGEHLEAAKRYDDAAVSYMSAGMLDKALRAYRAAGRWRMVFVVAGQLEYDEEAVQSLAVELAEELAGSGQAADAAAVLLGYLGDVDNAVRVYTQAREWRESIRVAHANQRSDLVETVVAPAAADGAASLLSEARDAEERIRKYGQRLADVRGKRLAMAEAIAAADEDGAAHGVPDDLQSDVVSLVSGLSVYTDATATGGTGASSSSASSRAPSTVGGRKAHRNDKKLKKAGARIRQGSPLEEASLVAHVHGLAPRPAQLEEAGQLAELLVLLGHADDARTLQHTVAAWQATYEEARSELALHPVPIDGPGHARAEMERLLQPAPDASSIAWKWDVLRGF